MKLLEVKNLVTNFYTDDGIASAVDDVSFELDKGETLGLVGESGCGKSVSALSIMRLIPEPSGKIESGKILFKGLDLLKLSEKEIQDVRGNKISMIFQEPMTSLNPAYTCGNQIDEILICHKKLTRKEVKDITIGLLQKVGIPAPEQRYKEYPHQLSGGMRQRVMIAIALACKPELLIADEPTTALDVTVQSQVLELIKNLQEDYEMGVILITHDFGVIAEVSNRVAVMYASKIVEYGNVDEIFYNTKHPYTSGLLKSIPKINNKEDKLQIIKGMVPSSLNYPKGCHFCTRCPFADDKCFNEEPAFVKISETHKAACFRI
jgi:peptide/nickel transport system ATP-binding protein